MGSRLKLHDELCEILGTRNAYFQPPESIKMNYPCIRYSKVGINSIKADNMNYKNTNRYEAILIETNPDSIFPDKILSHFQMCSADRMYVSDNLYHYPFTIYY